MEINLSQDINAPSWWAKPCNQCSSGTIMPDCSLFCSLTMMVAKGKCESYNIGLPSIYLLDKLLVEKNQTKVKKTTTKKQPAVSKVLPRYKKKVDNRPRLFEL